MLLIAAEMVPISPFQTLWDDRFSDPGDWCTPHRVRDGLTIRQWHRRLIGDGINLAASACHSRFFCSRARRRRCRRKLAEVVPHKNMIHPLATASKLVASLLINWCHCFTFPQKVIQFVWTKYNFHAVKSVGLIN